MNCAESLELLSEFHADALDEILRREIHTHLEACAPCKYIMVDIEIIVETAHVLRESSDGVSFPDENIIWSRISFFKGQSH